MTRINRRIFVFALFAFSLVTARTSAEVLAGFAATDITPKIDGPTPVYLAGYGQNRKATSIHDPLYARASVIEADGVRVALAAVDLVGIQYPVIERIRAKLPGFKHVLLASTHSHEGPDVIGLWGPGIGKSGVDPAYIDLVVQRVVEAIKLADQNKTAVTATYGEAHDKTLLRDARPPFVFDDALRVIHCVRKDTGKAAGMLVVWGSHPESLGSKNPSLTRDFPHYTVTRLEKMYSCPVVYFSGSLGGLMTNPPEITTREGKKIHDETFEYAEVYGNFVADLADKAIAGATPATLEPIKIGVEPVSLPLENPTYHMMWNMGVMQRPAYEWKGDPSVLGEPVKAGKTGIRSALRSEVNYLALGDVNVVGIPGELYPELLYGKFQEPVEPNADFPDAKLEKSVYEQLPGKKIFFIGLANDEIGYIIPLRQWDWKAPFCYGSKDRLYGEINSCGSQMAPILMSALERAIAKAK